MIGPGAIKRTRWTKPMPMPRTQENVWARLACLLRQFLAISAARISGAAQ